jgi:uncharacterized protein (UPF0548 family)
VSEEHSQTASGDCIWRDKSGHRKNLTERDALTNWRPHREGQVRTQKESDCARGAHQLETTSGGTSQEQKESNRVRHTHSLDTTSGGTSQDMERIQPSKVHSRPGDRIGRDKSGHRKNPTEQGALTIWRPHQEAQVRTQKESDRARHTHELETTSGGASQDTERIQQSEAQSPPGDHIGRDKSGHRKNLTG